MQYGLFLLIASIPVLNENAYIMRVPYTKLSKSLEGLKYLFM